MSYVSFYLKYRPRIFKEVVGQNHITQTLSNAIAENRLSHAYLFCGPRGTGKTTVARILAKALNCAEGPTPEPCNQCQVCREINGDSSMDVLEIDAASNRGIDEIRDLREKVRYTPVEGRYKVYIIDEVHMLTDFAFNALLKTLEEPPPNVIFVLATTEAHKVLPTIHSRSQRFDFRRISVSDIVGRLQTIANEEKIQVDDSVFNLIGRHAQGSLRDAISILDQLSSFTGKKIDLESVSALLGTVDVELLFEMAEILRNKNASEALLFVDRLVENGRDISQFVKELIEHFRHLFIIKYADKPEEIINVTPETINRLAAQAADFEGFELMRFVELLNATFKEMKWNPDARLLLEMALIKLIRLEVDISIEGLLYRIEEAEKRIIRTQIPSEEVREVHPVGSKKAGLPAKKVEAERSEKAEEAETAIAKEKLAEEEKTIKQAGEKTPVLNHDAGDKVKAVQNKVQEKIRKGEKGTTPPAEAERREEPAAVDLMKVKRAWPVILDKIKTKSLPVSTLLLECQPSEVIGRTVILKFREVASFHKKETEKPANLALIKRAIKDIIGVDIEVRCELGKGVLLEKEPHPATILDPQNSKAQPAATDMSRHHLVKLFVDDFGAELVDEIKLEEESS